MTESSLLGATWSDEPPTITTNPTNDSSGELGDIIFSPLTLTAKVDISTPHEPSRRRSLVERFEKMLSFDEAVEADCYDSDGNEPPCVVEEEFEHFENSLDQIIGTAAVTIPAAGNFVFLDTNAIDRFKVDELRQELEKRGLSKTGLKAELTERLKKAMVKKNLKYILKNSFLVPTGLTKDADGGY